VFIFVRIDFIDPQSTPWKSLFRNSCKFQSDMAVPLVQPAVPLVQPAVPLVQPAVPLVQPAVPLVQPAVSKMVQVMVGTSFHYLRIVRNVCYSVSCAVELR